MTAKNIKYIGTLTHSTKKIFFIAYYLTFDGFKLAATYVNVELTAKAAEEEKT